MFDLHATANLAVIAVTLVVTFLAFQDPELREHLLFDTGPILHRGEVHRLLSSGFIHADWGHFAFNMFSLFSFGGAIERVAGAGIFLLIYFASMVGGSLVSLALHRRERYRALGASGGVSGVIFSSIFLFPGGSVQIFPFPVPIPSWLYAILFVAISLYGIRTRAGNVGHDAHLGGALVGLGVTTALFPEVVAASPLLFAGVLAVILAAFPILRRLPR